MFDFAVVGSGIGGSSIAAYLNAKGHNVALFEKESYLGGCSSSFSHSGYLYNTGATTLAGYQEGFVVKEMFDKIGFTPNVIASEPAIVLIQNGKTTPRYKNLPMFLNTLSKNYPHEKNEAFWKLIYHINTEFYKLQGHYYANATLISKIISLASFLPIALKFKRYLTLNAYDFITDFFGELDEEYRVFLESQILIVAQAGTKKINFFTAALALGYTFNQNYYAVGGFSKLFDDMTAKIENIYKNTHILSIKKQSNYFELSTKSNVFKAKKVILNTTIYDSAKLFDAPTEKNYYKKYEKLDNHQSSFMLYMTIKSDKKFHHHYQLIQNENFPHTISKALFVSISDQSDTIIAPQGHYSITASIHTDTRFWKDKTIYKHNKNELKEILFKKILDILHINKDEVVHSFAATPKTFAHYINRSQLGGNAMSMKNFLPFLPGNDTPIKNLYHVGDTVYAAQGWPGVMTGVKNLTKLLHG